MKKSIKQKLELTWIGKGDEPKLEPRILIENPEYSFGEVDTDNKLIQGDNLLALKALEADYRGLIKCIYIDPPFNTGAAFDHYDDGIEHSIWLNLMKQRIQILHLLLHEEGSIFIHLDDNELDYCKIILDEIFGRANFINRITVDVRSPSAFSTVNPGVFKASEYILWYAKDKSKWESRSMRVPTSRDSAYNKYIPNFDEGYKNWNIQTLKLAFLEKLNSDRKEYIYTFLDNLSNNEFHTVSDLLKNISSNFKFDQLVDLKKLSNYLYKKLNEETKESFIEKSYPYLLEKVSINYKEKDIDEFVFENANRVFRETEISDSGAGRETVELKNKSKDSPNETFLLKREGDLDDIYVKNGKQISFYSKNVGQSDGKVTATKLLTNIWTDISWEGIAKEGNVTFKKGKKPERLLQRCLELTTNKGDWVLDSFLGSGTTCSVAHKMERKWIGIEIGAQATTHCYPRLKDIVTGKDQGGISKSVNWKGGGGFKFYTLAPSLLNKDKFGNWVISKEYNPAMMAGAMAKQEGFRYDPDEHIYWKQGRSSEKDFIYTTTQFITVEMFDKIQDEMQPDESLLIACKAYHSSCENRHANISIKKIPHMLFGRCEFGKEDYSFNIVNLPKDESEEEGFELEESTSEEADNINQTELF